MTQLNTQMSRSQTTLRLGTTLRDLQKNYLKQLSLGKLFYQNHFLFKDCKKSYL